MSEDHIYITPSDIKDFLYCPYIMYLKKVRGIEEPVTELMRYGKDLYNKYLDRSSRQKTLLGLRRIKHDEVWYRVELYSQRYRVYGVADAVYRVGRRYSVLEIKYGECRGKVPRDHFYQGVSYAVMYEESYRKKVSSVTLYYINSDALFDKRVIRMHREYWETVVQSIWDIVNGKSIPRPSYSLGKCSVCFFKNYCPR
jgi:CRISPR-associated exonuclease Cas4